jgi:hypothetical protein
MNDAMDVALCLALLALRAAIGLAGYSGEGKPPMYGDFEAQRHWMELTVNLPPSHWYVHGSDNDLLYWGLDYPPLSAHASWLVGMFAQRLHPDLVALHASRGIETAATRAFMRNSVLVLDALIYLPAVYACAAYAAPPTGAHRGRRLLLVLQLAATPALVLTDHGHFQYNCVSLGLGLWGMLAAMGGRPHASAIAFSLALNFKQMSLYLAPAFFCYLLAGCLRTRRTVLGKALATSQLAFTVLATFALCWLPFLGSAEAALAVVRRIFPVERHLYEDKVANLWCTLALLPFLKLKAIFPLGTLLRLALGTTLLGLLPPCGLLLARPSRLGFLLCATACALSFFLCSFQVRMHCLETCDACTALETCDACTASTLPSRVAMTALISLFGRCTRSISCCRCYRPRSSHRASLPSLHGLRRRRPSLSIPCLRGMAKLSLTRSANSASSPSPSHSSPQRRPHRPPTPRARPPPPPLPPTCHRRLCACRGRYARLWGSHWPVWCFYICSRRS